ncbi:transposase family protein [Candidatus Saccharibacteria bacterium]|nr:MAG: transposase family protein [Candidatus Saccharibacteria bacterium]QQS70089.1 MAG: transposase family protein [Candidatus Saccharibacteria bacterium]
MTITMQQHTLPTIEELRQFVSGTQSLDLTIVHKQEAYAWLQQLVVRLDYQHLGKKDKGVVREYAIAVTGYSRAQVTRLIGQYLRTGCIALEPVNMRNQFALRYTREDIGLLAELDDAHDRLSGKAAKVLAQRAFVTFGDARYERLSAISVSHIYNLRGTVTYRNQSHTFTKTQATTIAIGERRKPRPNGQPGFIRIDTVHQGDKDKEKGVYHINLVDEVTQWEVVVAVERITERYMLPALEAALVLFPFVIVEFHADNGSEYINKQVAALLKAMLIKLSKSRAYQSGDNGLVETKNGSIIRKALGYAHIPREYAPDINSWYCTWFVPYLNFHRPCGYRITSVDSKTGKRTHRYPVNGYMVPYEKLKSLPDAKQYLKTGSSFEKLDEVAYAESDTAWAIAMNKAKDQLLKTLYTKR